MPENKLLMFENRLRKVYKHFAKIARKQQVACFRFYDHDMPEFPFVIENYNGAIHAAEYKRRHTMEEAEHETWVAACKEIIAQVVAIDPTLVFMKMRQRKEGKEGQYQKLDTAKQERIVPEGDLNFIINLTDYLDTGLFLDHRITRNLVRQEARGKRVLNLFCYTGSFTVYAAKGGARSITSVDLSKTYINWAKRNLQFNKLFDAEKHEMMQGDVMQIINDLPKDTFDIIICDPPTFSNSKRMDEDFDVQRDHVTLLRKLLKACTDTGKIYFSNNYRGFSMDRDALPASIVRDITAATTPFDFQGKLHRSCYLIQK
ncbi:MAG: class I SAM-dependent methyltransferase [Chitinophagaceae bacterium]|nr:class I SAM-dependent methyltransferase [Chitinophagaceae bacterium]